MDEKGLLKDVRRFGQMQDVQAVLSGEEPEKRANGVRKWNSLPGKNRWPR